MSDPYGLICKLPPSPSADHTRAERREESVGPSELLKAAQLQLIDTGAPSPTTPQVKRGGETSADLI